MAAKASVHLSTPQAIPGTTPAERPGRVGIVVAAGMDHQGMSPDGAQVLDARSGQLLLGGTVGPDREDRQIAEMAVTLRSRVFLRPFRVPVAAGRTARD